MSIALSLEHGQGLARCGHILARAVPRGIGATVDQQCQHRAVGKFRGGLGCCSGICLCAFQIVAVLNLNRAVTAANESAYCFVRITSAPGFNNVARIVAVIDKNRAAGLPYDTAASAAEALNFPDVIAIIDLHICAYSDDAAATTTVAFMDQTGVIAADDRQIGSKTDDTAARRRSRNRYPTQVSAVFDGAADSIANDAAASCEATSSAYRPGHCQILNRGIFCITEQTAHSSICI